MSTVSLVLPADGDTIDAADVNVPFTTLAGVINGNLDSTNISSLNGSKISAGTIPSTALGASVTQGWYTGLNAPSSITSNGNRSYTCVFNATDYSSTLSPGIRIRTTRSVAAPTQCTSLNGTTQYYSKTSPAGMTFTATCTTMGWRKLNAYSAQWFGGRTTGTNGFRYGVNASGQLIFEVQPGNATTKTVTSYQSVPLTKGFRFAFQIDLAGTCQIMLDGVPIPSTTAGSATSLTQASADFQLGAAGGAGFTNGKMAQDAIFSAKLADATVQSYEGQSYLGTEASLISAYSFNNSINDLNTSNANNLTANGSAVATSADSPFGGQAGGTISSTLDYGIVQSVTFSTNTTVVIQVPEGCTIPTSGGVSAVGYSSNKAPYGMPIQRGKWRISSLMKVQATQSSAASDTWYNVGSHSLNIPIGEWSATYQSPSISQATTTNVLTTSLSTANNTGGDPEFEAVSYNNTTSVSGSTKYRERPISLAAATPYYLNHAQHGGTSVTIYNLDNSISTAAGTVAIIEAENAYL